MNYSIRKNVLNIFIRKDSSGFSRDERWLANFKAGSYKNPKNTLSSTQSVFSAEITIPANQSLLESKALSNWLR